MKKIVRMDRRHFGQHFVKGDHVRLRIMANRTPYEGVIRHAYREDRWWRRSFLYEVIPDQPVAGSRSPLRARQSELESA